MSKAPTIVWLRQDLRLADHPALAAAEARKCPIIPIYIWDPAGEGDWAPGGATRWWLHHSLVALSQAIGRGGGRLVLRAGNSEQVLADLMNETGAEAVYWSRRYEPNVIDRDKGIKERLQAAGVEVRSFNASLLHEPHTVANKQGNPFQVFTPY
ncbi:MAG: deoxyribodipyrimidine photo-lyase [Candidatus Synoicihabitans palmerolidicus]|nr:deoxyribodipyrimidine photo-lyase [Candidatus Synoicihabitans palmerolidicus]